METIGRCRLCLKDGTVLQGSHLLPKGLYRLFRTDGPNPNPWIVTPEYEAQTSRQEKKHLLCAECEQRLSKNGELWVLRNTLKPDGSFRLASMLAAHPPKFSTHKSKLYLASQIPEVNVSAIAYFAASIFWRASVWPWKVTEKDHVRLGPFAEPFRLYLMQQADWPKCAALAVIVREKSDVSFLCHDPSRSKVNGIHAYAFPMPGLSFTMFVSKQVSDEERRMCFVQGDGNPIGMGTALEFIFMNAARKALARHDPSIY